MKTSILRITALAFVVAACCTPITSLAQYNVGEGFEVAWSLDPRDAPDLFPRGPAFGARSVLTGMDFDNDGNLEILFTTDETLAPQGPDPGIIDVFLYENVGDNEYAYVWHYSNPDSSNSLPALGFGDIDDDGLSEIYLGIPTLPRLGSPNDLFIFEQNDDLTFPAEPTTAYGYEREIDADFRPAGFQIVDVDGDGQKELLTVSRTGGARELVVITPDAGIDAFSTFSIEFEAGNEILDGGGVYDVDVVDFDGDGNNEIWVNTWNNWSMSVFEATGPDTYELQLDLDAFDENNDPGSFNSHDINFHDLDGDGALEGFFPMTNGVYYYLGANDDVSTLTGADFMPVGTFATRSRGGHIGDIDSDGLLDIVASGGRDETISRMEYDGAGDPADSTSYAWSVILESIGEPQDRYYPLRIAEDLDGDGRNEVVATNLFATEPGQPILIILEASDMATANEPLDLPDGYALDQNYPNPFNPSTTIAYTLGDTETVSLHIYNAMGQRVRTLVNGAVRHSGQHQVVWNGQSDDGATLGSGIYFYSLEFGTSRVTRAMLLLK